MELVTAFLVGGLFIGAAIVYPKGKRDAAYRALKQDKSLVISGDPSFFCNWYVAYAEDGRVHYNICASKDIQAVINSRKNSIVAYGTLDNVEIFRTPEELNASHWRKSSC